MLSAKQPAEPIMSPSSDLPLVRLKPRKALPFFCHHPWVYESAIQHVSKSARVGDEVIVQAEDGQFIARGLFNPNSKIRIRLYDWEENGELNAEVWRSRIQAAIALRRKLYADSETWKACRLIYSESDQLSGVTVDRVDDWLVVQWTSAALLRFKDEIIQILIDELSPKGIWLRTEKGIRDLEALSLEDGLLWGESPPRPLFIRENGLQFGVDLIEGQKTGFYFDQRENRAAIRPLAAGARVLDVCTYSGSFALNAASHPDCRHVLAIDSSESALEMARLNAELNGLSSKVTFRKADASEGMQELIQTGDRFDLMILDPPKLVRSRGGVNRAMKAYLRMNSLALQLLNPNGCLLTCSCSGLLERSDFERIIAQASLDVGRPVQFLQQRGQASDHPVLTSCPETAYLKASLCRVVD